MKLATQDKPFFPVPLGEKLKAVRRLGFDTFEIDGRVLVENLSEVKTAIKESGVPVETVCGGYRGWIGDFDQEKRATAIAEITRILQALAEINGRGIVVPAAWGMFSKRLPPLVPPRSEEEDREVLLDSLAKLNRVALATGTLIYLEPLNRYEDHMLNTLAAAGALIKAGNFAGVKLTADLFHMNIEEAGIERSIHEAKALLGHVHIADSHRYEPGTGHLDFVPIFKALKDSGYQGQMAFECRVLGEPAAEAYRRSVAFIRACLQEAGF
ncbi:MAG TPA: sugar phosphate isomerase/epimerase family protein [Capillibacterium sp.]